MQVVNMSASIQSQSSTRSAQSSSRDGTGGINQPSDVCGFQTFTVSFFMREIDFKVLYLSGPVKHTWQ